MTRIIGLCGPEGAGKSTVARAMCWGAGGSRELIGFATPLRGMLRGFYATLGLSNSEIDRRLTGDLKETPDPLLHGRTPRYALRTLGTEWGRKRMAPSLWVDAWKERVEDAKWRGAEIVVADDVRFENEVDAIRALGGEVVEIVREGRAYLEDEHVSAARLPDRCIDRVVPNDASPEDAAFLTAEMW